MNNIMQISPLLIPVNEVQHTRHVHGRAEIVSQLTFFKQSNENDILLYACQLSALFRIK